VKIHFNNYARNLAEKWYMWKVFVDEDDTILDKIESVLYLLPQAFANPARVVYDRESKFALKSSSSQGFTIFITISTKEGVKQKARYNVDLGKEWPSTEITRPISEDTIGELALALEEIRRLTTEAWQSDRRTFYADDSPEGHSERIIKILNDICGDMMKTDRKLNKQEIFILLASAYLHDIGMQYTDETEPTVEDVRNRHHIFSEKMIIGSVEEPLRYASLAIPPEYVSEIAQVSRGHRETDLRTKDYEPIQKYGERIRLRLLTALLSLAGGLDISDKRVIINDLRSAPLAQEDRVYWWRYYYVKDVSIENGKVSIHFVFPSSDHRAPVVASFENQLEGRINQLSDTLWEAGVKLYLGEHKIEYSEVKERMSPDDLNFLGTRQQQLGMLGLKRSEIEMSDFLKQASETLGVNMKYRQYVISLKYEDPTSRILKGEISFLAIVRNEADEAKKLFPDGKILDGLTTIPEALKSKPPRNAKEIADFEELQIGGKYAHFKKHVEYLNSGTKEKGVRREVICDELIAPGTAISLSYNERILLDEVDNLSRRFVGISFGIVEVQVHHSPDILPDIFWFKRSESDIRTSRLAVSPDEVVFRAEGKWLPGTGFLLSWKKKN